MGRSVNYLRGALHVAYINFETNDEEPTCEHCGSQNVSKTDEYGEYICHNCEKGFEWYMTDAEMEWEDFVTSIEEILRDYPSLDILSDKKKVQFEGNEVRILAENSHCEIAISEYCGLVSVSIRVARNDYVKESLAENWINQVWPGIQKKLDKRFDTLTRLGTFSNGEGVYQSRKK